MSKDKDNLKNGDSKKDMPNNWITNVYVKASIIFATLVVLCLGIMNVCNLGRNLELLCFCWSLCLLAITSLINVILRIKFSFMGIVMIVLVIMIEIEIGVAALIDVLNYCQESYRPGIIGTVLIMITILMVFTVITRDNNHKHY